MQNWPWLHGMSDLRASELILLRSSSSLLWVNVSHSGRFLNGYSSYANVKSSVEDLPYTSDVEDDTFGAMRATTWPPDSAFRLPII